MTKTTAATNEHGPFKSKANCCCVTIKDPHLDLDPKEENTPYQDAITALNNGLWQALIANNTEVSQLIAALLSLTTWTKQTPPPVRVTPQKVKRFYVGGEDKLTLAEVCRHAWYTQERVDAKKTEEEGKQSADPHHAACSAMLRGNTGQRGRKEEAENGDVDTGMPVCGCLKVAEENATAVGWRDILGETILIKNPEAKD